MLMMQSGPSRGIAAAPSGGVSYTGDELLTLNAALDGTAGYRYWNPAANYAGAFRVPSSSGASDMHDSAGCIAYHSGRNSVFITGWYPDHCIAEFTIPTLVQATDHADMDTLNLATTVQGLFSFETAGQNEYATGIIAGLYIADGANQLLITNFHPYAQDDNYNTPYRVIRDCTALSSSTVDGYFTTPFDPAAGGWCSAIPSSMQSALGGTHLNGFSNSGARRSSTQSLSMGPAAYAGNIGSLMANSETTPEATASSGITQYALCRYRLGSEGLVPEADLYNWVENPSHTGGAIISTTPQWTALGDIAYGEIVPGTRTYMLWGCNSMVDSGGWYGSNDGGTRPSYVPFDPSFESQGPHPIDPDDCHYYYWLINVDELEAVKAGTKQPYEVEVYECGKFPMALDTVGGKYVGGGARKNSTNQVFITLIRQDDTQAYDSPAVLVYNLGW